MAESPLLSRYLLSQLAGMQFAGKRDLYDIFGYKRALSYDDLYAKYKRQDIAGRVVEEPVKAIWSRPPEIKDKTIQVVWNRLQHRLDLWQSFARADKLCAFGEFSVLFLGLRGAPDAPVKPLGGRGSNTATESLDKELLYVQPYSTKEATIESLVDDPRDPRFGLPLMYKINLGSTTLNTSSTGAASASKTIKVHHSRVIHITDPLLVDNVRSSPRLERVYNVLDDILKVGGGSAETYWLTASRGMQINVDKDMDLTPEDEASLTEELDEFQHQLRRYVRTRGVEITELKSQVTDPAGTFDVLLTLLASATGIPKRILMGAEAGQLASEQDRANWAVQIEARRKEFAEPYIIRPFLQKMSSLSILPPIEETVELVWPEAFRMSPLERAQEMAQKARSVVNLSRQVIAGHPIVTTDEARNVLGLEPNDDLPEVDEGVELAWKSKGLDPETGEQIQPEDPQDPEDSANDPEDIGTTSRPTESGNNSSTGRQNAVLTSRSPLSSRRLM